MAELLNLISPRRILFKTLKEVREIWGWIGVEINVLAILSQGGAVLRRVQID